MRRRKGAALLIFLVLTAGSCTKKPRVQTPVRGGKLDVTIRDLGTLDPARAGGRGSLLVVSQIFDSLTAIDPMNQKVKPAAASSWSVSADGLTWRFRIAKRKFHDGEPVRARDFKFAFDRIAQKSLKADTAYQLEPVHGFADARVSGKAKQLAGVTAPRDDLLVIKLDRPFYELPYLLAHPGLAPIPFAAYRRSTAALRTAPIGNGPFRVSSVAPAKEATLVRFDGYAGSPSYLDQIVLRVVPNVDQGWRSFLSGRTQIADIPISALQAGSVKPGGRGFTPVWATLSFGVNLKLPKYADPRARRAISLAIDRVALATSVYGDPTAAATGIVARGVRGFAPDSCTVCGFDRARATLTLRSVFRGKPPAITIDHLSDRSSTQVARAVGNDLTAAGLRTTLRAHSPAAYEKLLASGKQDLAELGWVADAPSPDGFLAQELGSRSRNNETGYKDRIFDGLIAAAQKERDETKRLTLYGRAEGQALRLMPLIPIAFVRNRTAVADEVRGFVLDGAGLFDASTVWLAQG